MAPYKRQQKEVIIATISLIKSVSSSLFNQNISRWNVSNVTIIDGMFQNSTAFAQDLSSWCVTNIETKPSGFDDGSGITAILEPVWGACPTV